MKEKILSKKIIKNGLYLALIILLIILIILYKGSKKSFSKYINSYGLNGKTEIAKPVFIVNGDDSIKIDGNTNTVYDFSVKNFDNDNVSDVALDYYISFVNNSEANLKFVLTKDGKNVELNDDSTSKLTLTNNEKQSDNYKLQILYTDNAQQTKDIKGNVQVKVEANQAEI